MTPDIEQLMRWASLVLTLPVMFYSAMPFFSGAWRDIKLHRVGMDVPVALGIGSAFAASCWATFVAGGEVYFDSVTMFVFFLLTGRYLEMMARQKATRGVEAISRALPAFAERYLNYPDAATERVAVALLAPGDVLRVKPGETVPADGIIVEGESGVDESLLTGESRPISKRAGETITGGSANIGSPLVMRVERVGEETRLAAIKRLMERAAAEKPSVVVMADRIAARFVAVLLVLAFVTGAAWWWVDPSRALWIFVAVLVVSCPCALSLATPAVLTVATGSLARLGVLVTRGHAIETLARATHLVFDKTGTLTEGHPVLVETVAPGTIAAAEALRMAASIEQGSEHSLGRALCGAAEGQLPAVDSVRAFTGHGMEAVVSERHIRIGTPEFVGELHQRAIPPDIAAWREAGNTVVALADATGWLAWFRFADEPRAGASETASQLRKLGLRVSVLSGDAPATVEYTAKLLGIDIAVGGMTPEAKHEHLHALQQEGAIVAMVGDGVNDAPVLAQAHVSVAMGGGTDLARSQADVVLLGDDLRQLAAGVALARRTLRIIRQNLAWAFGYNLLAIPLAMAGLVTPWMAGIGMSASSLLVVLNALRLQKDES
jgi:Cu2+-exporting ATPase